MDEVQRRRFLIRLLAGTVQFERSRRTPEPNSFITGTHNADRRTPTSTTSSINQGYQSRHDDDRLASRTRAPPATTHAATIARSSPRPFQAKITQHLLNGFGIGVNTRFIAQAINNRRITDSAFRQQLLYTINQVENIYWALVERIRECAVCAARARPIDTGRL